MFPKNDVGFPCVDIGDGRHMATMHPPPAHLNETKFFGALGYTEHVIECQH